MTSLISVADLLAPSFCNGPGVRAVLYVQGCELRCPGCHNPHTWDKNGGRALTVDALLDWYRSIPKLRGLTLSGGEPFEQAGPLAALCRAVRELGGDVVAFSGFVRSEIESAVRPFARELLAEVDLLIDGPYIASQACDLPLRGSANQAMHFLSGRIDSSEITRLPRSEWVGREGQGRVSGFQVRKLARLLTRDVSDARKQNP